MIYMHVDANSAFLSWSSVDAIAKGSEIDYRTVPAVVGGDEAARHGVVLAKSVPAKSFGIVTGESLMEARRKCPDLIVLQPDFEIYQRYSDAMYRILCDYSSEIERYSIDECFLDYTASEKIFGNPVKTAYAIKDRIKNELGFTVNVGVSDSKILAKMGSELKKPDRVHTLWPSEMAEKLWPLPVDDLFMVGKSSAKKLRSIGIDTIGKLAAADEAMLVQVFKSYGPLLHSYANGRDYGSMSMNHEDVRKGVGNSITIDHDVLEAAEAKVYLLHLCEKVSSRLRAMQAEASRVSVSIRTSGFLNYGHQEQTDTFTNTTKDIYGAACRLFDECWHGEPIRLLNVTAGGLRYAEDDAQISLFDTPKKAQDLAADKVMDDIRARFGKDSIKRGSLI